MLPANKFYITRDMEKITNEKTFLFDQDARTFDKEDERGGGGGEAGIHKISWL